MAKRRTSTRKTFKKKGTAKTARKKGQSVYKVKGGYRLSKKRRGFSLVPMLLVMCFMMVAFAGCYEAIDRTAQAGQTIAQTAQDALNSPAGALVPEPMRTGAEIAAGAIALISGYWLKRSKDLYKVATKELIAGGEEFKTMGGDSIEGFKTAHRVAQGTKTKLLVNKIKAA